MAPPYDFTLELNAMRPTLMRLALLQLRNQAWAEDAVSETMLAAIEGIERFSHQSKLQTWVVGILKHKVLDQLRLRRREAQYEHHDESEDQPADEDFTANGRFRDVPERWETPADALQQLQFFKILEMCMDTMPGQLGRVFLMREWLELESEAICQELQITPTNLWKMLSRARLRLRQCLQIHWFEVQTS